MPSQGKLPDYDDPVVLSAKRCTVEDFCNRLHKTMIKQFKCEGGLCGRDSDRAETGAVVVMDW